ncbi:1-propanol dehydrogenase PduQ [Proteiniclasticum sp. C24MP]|uniref:1-propanol dehydrogenase PduQ n=1 Tax=Proteiniclasticum sp. C24MP TaxID=3374101 RepID=UPI003754D138
MKDFNVKPVIVYGENALDRLDEYRYRKACIVTDGQIIKLGLLKLLTDKLERNQIAYEVFDEVVPDTTSNVVEKGLMHIIRSKPDVVFAMGGGSSIDTAKAVIFYFQKLKETFMSDDVIVKPILIAIPTTAGTGSEVTEYAVVTDSVSGAKIPITSKVMLPDFAILDPRITKTAPDFITADTGIDTLTHAIEAYVSKGANEFSDSYALQAINLIFDHLIPAYQDGNNLMRREKLQIASSMAGIAFNNASLGINHSIAHALGAKFHLSHGKCNGILLPYVIEYNAKNPDAMKRYAEIAKNMGFSFTEDQISAFALIESVVLLKKALNIPENLIEAGIDRNDVINALDELTAMALKDMCTSGNPIVPTEQDLRGILLKMI